MIVIDTRGRGPVWHDAAALFGLRDGQELKTKEDSKACEATGKPVFVVMIREVGAARGRCVGHVVYEPGERIGVIGGVA